ncbi:MAG: DUF3223 domain-containing protein [Pseudomonadales bacterium]|nr:DUF3223 domain-containing protein [Pseudomonadales bacterium]
MITPTPILFGEFSFKTKSAAERAIRRRINHYEKGDIVSPDDFLFFGELFKLHHEYEHKKGPGIEHIRVRRDFSGRRFFYIQRIDG